MSEQAQRANEGARPSVSEPSAADDQVKRLAAAIRKHAHDEMPCDTIVEQWQEFARRAFDDAQIELTEEQFDRAWRRLWQSAFYGGNYTLDAKRVLAAASGKGDAA